MSLKEARALAKNGALSKAKEMLQQLHEQDPTCPDILSGLAQVTHRLAEYEESLFFCALIVTQNENKKDFRICRIIADNYKELTMYEEALKAYDQALAIAYNIECRIECILRKAKVLMLTNRNNESRTLYQEALAQNTDHKPMLKARIQHEYATLLLYKFKEVNAAQILFARSLAINPNNTEGSDMYKYCIDYMEDKREQQIKQHTLDPTDSKDIKLIVYKFDDIIFAKHEPNIYLNMKHKDLLHLFGGQDRIDALRHHFERINGNLHLKLGLVTVHHEKLICDLLIRTQLMDFFKESFYSLHTDWNEIDTGFTTKNRCYVAMHRDQEEIDKVREYCKILYMKPYENCCFPGLKLIDMQHIEGTFHLESEVNIFYNIGDMPFEIPESMMQHDANIYGYIKTEIETMPNASVEHLKVFQWIQDHLREYRACYSEFCYKFGDCCRAMKQRSYWLGANWLYQLLHMESNDSELHGKYGKCLGHLGFDTEADAHFVQSLQLKQDSYSVHEAYAEHLFNCRRFGDAIKELDRCRDLKKLEGGIAKHTFYTLYAKCLDFGNLEEDSTETAKYYQTAIQYCNNQKHKHWNIARCHADYGAFLKKQQQWREARHEYETALQLDPRNAYLYWKLSTVLFASGLQEEHTIPLIKALKINCTFEPALRDYERYFGKPYDDERDESKEDLHIVQDVRNLHMNPYPVDRNNNNNNNNNNSNCNTNDRNIQNAFTETPDASTSYVSAPSTTLSKWHPNNKWQHEFNRMYWNKFGAENETNKNRFKGYLNEMIMASFNDIRMVIKHDAAALNKQMRIHINIDHMEDLQKIGELFEEIKNEYGLFMAFCDANDIDDRCRQEVLEKNGVFSVAAMRLITSRQDLMLMISNAELHTGNEKQLTNDIWSLIQQINK